MKHRSISLLTVLILNVLFTGFVGCNENLQGYSKELSTPNNGNQTDKLNVTTKFPDSVKGVGDKNVDQDGRSQQKPTKNSMNDTEKNIGLGGDKPLKESKGSGDLSKESLSEGSSKKNPHTLDLQIAGCDPSNRCVDKKNNLIACLRVPGTDTQALSLVIQNKGKGSLDVKIIAPSFANLEHSEMRIKAKEDKEVKVYVNAGGAKDSMITLQAGEGLCRLDFRNIMPSSVSKSKTLIMSRFISTSTGYVLLGIFLAGAALASLAWLCVQLRRLLRRESGPKYQKLEVGLPVSTGAKKEADSGGDGWEDSWETGWDEEEVPVTPAGAISSPSLKGLASRRFNKEGWKD